MSHQRHLDPGSHDAIYRQSRLGRNVPQKEPKSQKANLAFLTQNSYLTSWAYHGFLIAH